MHPEYRRAIADVLALLADHAELHERIAALAPPESPAPPPRHVDGYEVLHRGRLVSRHSEWQAAYRKAQRALQELKCGCGECIELVTIYADGKEAEPVSRERGTPGCGERTLQRYQHPIQDPSAPTVFDELEELE